jgi:hypothetical protein
MPFDNLHSSRIFSVFLSLVEYIFQSLKYFYFHTRFTTSLHPDEVDGVVPMACVERCCYICSRRALDEAKDFVAHVVWKTLER